MSDMIVVQTTTETREQAERIARVLVEARLAACVQVSGPIESCYRWQGAVTNSQEWVCSAKTRSLLYDQLESAIRRHHPYQTPEIIAVPVAAGSADYLAWLEAETQSETP